MADEEERFDFKLRAMLDPSGICSRCLGISLRNMDYMDCIEGQVTSHIFWKQASATGHLDSENDQNFHARR